MSEEMHRAFDREVGSLLDRAEQRAHEIIALNRPLLDSLVETLLDRETLEGAVLLQALEPAVAAPANGRAKTR
jgi:ATP-dependent Zn protease